MSGGDRSVTGPAPIVVEEADALGPYLDAWDRLAVDAGRPFCAPAWMLAWWRNGRTGHTKLRIVLAVDDDGDLVGVGPFFAQIGPMRLAEYRLLAAGFSHRIGPLAAAGRQADVAGAIAAALADADPPPASIVFEGVDASDGWPELVAAHWPRGRTQLRTDLTMDAPTIDLAGDYEAWMSRRDRRFRKEARRTKRRLDELEVTSRHTPDHAAVDALLSLHEARWKDRGGSNLGAGAREVITDAAGDFGEDSGRLGILLLEAPRGPIAAELVIRAGPTMAFWAGGFDPSWSTLAPGTQAMLAALGTAPPDVTIADLGGGAHEYKRRMADSSAPLVWRTVFPLGPRYPLIRLRLAPKHLRAGIRSWFRRLPPSAQSRLRRLMGDRT
jgi:CelD/BcsL family acetyltransferase involved in cellulose biosynthesis